MLDFLVTIMAFILGLGVLITFHEWGHFLVARACGVKILCFSIGFGKTLVSRTAKNGTEYRIAVLPLGGYVKMLGEGNEIVSPQDRESAFNRKSVWARTAIVLAGPLFNFIFAFFAYMMMLMIGVQGMAPLVGEIQPNSIAHKAGLKAPLEIIAVDDKPTNTWQEVLNQMIPKIGEEGTLKLSTQSKESVSVSTQLPIYDFNLSLKDWHLDSKNPDLIGSLGIVPLKLIPPAIVGTLVPNSVAQKSGLLPNDQIISIEGVAIPDANVLISEISKRPNVNTTFKVIRASHKEPIDITLKPAAKVLENGKLSGHIGITLKPMEIPPYWIRTQKYSFLESLKPAYQQTVHYTKVSFKLIGKMVMGHLSPSSLSGPIGIAQGAGATFKHGFQYYLGFLALISISLGVVNLLPIPVLDGGHLFYYMIEIITRRPVSQKIQEKAAVFGLFFIIGLMGISFYNDIARLF